MYISIVIPLSRPELLPLVAEQLDQITDCAYKFELVATLDNVKVNKEAVFKALEGRGITHRFKNITLIPLPEHLRKKPARRLDVISRRNRITLAHNLMREQLGASSFVFGFEDDTVLPDGVLKKLTDSWVSRVEDCGIVQGVQAGRWSSQYIGAWRSDNVLEPTEFESMPYKKKGLEEIDGGGLFCFLTPTAVYREMEFYWVEPMGPDVWFGVELRRRGLVNYIDWSIPCGHVIGDEVLWPSEGTRLNISLVKGRPSVKMLR